MDNFGGQFQKVALWVIVAALAIGGVAMILPFVPALLWAIVLSVLMYPLYSKARTRMSRAKALANGRADTVASLVTTVATLLVICIPFVLVGVLLFLQLGSVGKNLSNSGGGFSIDTALVQLDQAVAPLAEKVGAGDFSFAQYFDEHRDEVLSSVRAPAGRFASNAAFTLLTLVIALVTMFFMLRDGRDARRYAYELVPLPKERTDAILQKVADTIHAVFIGTVLVALIQGAIIGVAYAIAGVPHALLLGVVSAVLCMVPLLGAPVVYVPVGAALLLQGNVVGGCIVLGTGFIVVSNIDNLLKPFFIGGRVNLHPMGVFFSILGGVLLIGPIGIMAGPMLLTLILGMSDVVRERLHAEAGTEQSPA